ncbi:hypothetical protein RLCC275e_33890 (plasmid) [Rhizobium brockwellii]|nr:hypothetical protein RLCC275e_33890 [Rhizobium brockwellii]
MPSRRGIHWIVEELGLRETTGRGR